MADTKQRILDKALELFNKNGIEYVGMRELAAALKIRVGNITYYFATKDELVNELSKKLGELNSTLFAGNKEMTLFDFLESRRLVSRNQAAYRCLTYSFVHIMEKNPLVKEQYSKTRQARFTALKKAVDILEDNGYIKPAGDKDSLVALLAMTGRLWLSETAVAVPHLSMEDQAKYYLRLLCSLFKPYASKKGLADISRFVETIK